ncbi:hypothetical protein PG984_014975 [Apiospora sp. TS-2023a]
MPPDGIGARCPDPPISAQYIIDKYKELLDLFVRIQNDPVLALCDASRLNQPVKIHILLSNGADYGLARRILQDAGPTKAVETLATAALEYYLSWTSNREKGIRLRSRFEKEYNTITQNVRGTTCDPNIHIEPGNTVYREWGPHSSAKSFENAWEYSLATLRKACRGKLPKTAHDVLFFTAIAKAMCSEINGQPGSPLETDLLGDLNRWGILMHTNPSELEALTRAIRNVWNIDIEKSTSSSGIHDDSYSKEDFADMLQHFQDLANDLVQTSHEVLVDRDPTIEPANALQEEDIWRRSSQAEPYALDQRIAHVGLPPKPPDKQYQMAESAVYIVMAGVAFAVVFAYLITCGTAIFRYPTTTRPLVYVPADGWRCDAAKVIERTYLLLSLLLGYLYPVTPTNLVTEPLLEESRGSAMSSTLSITTESDSPTPTTAQTESPLAEASLLPESHDNIGSAFPCPQCPRQFPKVGILNRHIREKHTNLRFPCSFPGCRREFKRNCYRKEHERTQHSGPASLPPSLPAAYQQLPVVERLDTAAAAAHNPYKRARTSYGD